MSDPADSPKLDTCGCCEVGLPPHKHHNRPGQPALSYRLGTHATFLRRMLSRFPTQMIPNGPNEGARPLLDLTTRALDDPAIALLDASATVLDVITFYQERIANEGYLLTAKERRSVLELARAIGYELNPGVAASTRLAFTVEEAKEVPGRATASKSTPTTAIVPKGTRVQSVPGPGQLPQTFETIEEIEARAEWNALKPQLRAAQEIGRGTSELFLKGTDTRLQPGDAILLVGDHREGFAGSERWDFRILQTVETYHKEDPKDAYTRVTWREVLGHERPTIKPADNPRAFVFRQRAALFGYNAPQWSVMPLAVKQAYKFISDATDATAPRCWGNDWPSDVFRIREGTDPLIHLDAVYPKILEGSWVVLQKPTYTELYKVEDVSFSSRDDFTLSAKTTLLRFDTDEHLDYFGLRETVVFAQSEQLELAEKPLTAPVYGSEIALDRLVSGPQKGQALVFSGKRARRVKVAERTQVVRVEDKEEVRPADNLLLKPDDGPGWELEAGDQLEITEPPFVDSKERVHWHLVDSQGRAGVVVTEPGDLVPEPASEDDETFSEIAFVEDVPKSDERTTLILADPLKSAYDRSTLSIGANVARATHGETVHQVLGSGDGTQANQRFTLNRQPLTYVPARTASGSKSTLQVRVDGVLWKEVPSLYQLDESSQSYIVRINDDGEAGLTLGPARLHTGATVDATYRSGTGPDGEVDAGSLTLLQTRPLGIREVTNPLQASGAEAPEKLEQARENAPLTVRTLDRIVSLKDFEDFARAFAGVGKAQAVALWDGQTRLVHITIASASGDEASPALQENLKEAIDGVRDPVQQVRVSSFNPCTFHVKAKVRVDSRHEAASVLSDVKAALEVAFAFDKRAFGQPVTAAEVLTVIQKVKGVVAADVDHLHRATEPAGPNTILPARTARFEEGKLQGAELLFMVSGGVDLEEMEE